MGPKEKVTERVWFPKSSLSHSATVNQAEVASYGACAKMFPTCACIILPTIYEDMA